LECSGVKKDIAKQFDLAIEEVTAKEKLHTYEVTAACIIEPVYKILSCQCIACNNEPREAPLNCDSCQIKKVLKAIDTM
jgi:hypothetical protein